MGAYIPMFTGSNLKMEPHLLENGQARRAHNTQFRDGAISSFRIPKLIGDLPAGSVSLYPVGDQWYTWASDVSVVSGPSAQEEQRLYFMGDGFPKMMVKEPFSTIPESGVVGATVPEGVWRRLGLPAPEAQPTASVSGTPTDPAAPSEAMAFVYTYVTELNEEGPPSKPTGIVSARPGQTITVGASVEVPTDGYSINRINIYKTGSIDVPEPEYQYLGFLSPGETTYAFTLGQETLGSVLQTVNWDRPPVGARGLISIANGMMAAFRGRDVLLSEPYQPHAWPIDYRFQTDDDIVGMAPIRGGFVIGTSGAPYVVSASSPAGARMEKIDQPLACASARGMVEINGSVLYPSPDGLILVSPGAAPRNITEGTISPDVWRSMRPGTFHAYSWKGRYVAFYVGDGGPAGMVIEPNGSGFSLLDMYAVGGYSDPTNGDLYLVINDQVMRWNAGDEHLPYALNTKVFLYPDRTAITALRVDADQYPVRVALYGDGQCAGVVNVCSSRPHRIRGLRARRWEALVAGKHRVRSLSFGRGMGDVS